MVKVVPTGSSARDRNTYIGDFESELDIHILYIPFLKNVATWNMKYPIQAKPTVIMDTSSWNLYWNLPKIDLKQPFIRLVQAI